LIAQDATDANGDQIKTQEDKMPTPSIHTPEWREPQRGENAGIGAWNRPNSPYDNFMESEGIPIHRAIGVHRVQDLPLKPWKRNGGSGTFIQLYGTEGLWGCYVVEVPGAGALHPEHHMYEEIYLVVEGRGTTEVWVDGSRKKHQFEWQTGSLFSIPMNAWHRVINARSTPALLLAATTAPNMINLVRNLDFIFNCSYVLRDRYSEAEDFFKPSLDIEPDPLRGLAMSRTNIIPDVFNSELPMDNRRSPGYRRMEPRMTENVFYQFIGQHENGRYSKAHAHASAAVLVCIKGKGYTYTWPTQLGITPWRDGHADQVIRQDYEHVGMVSAAPMSGDWFHAHFGVSKEPMRLLGWYGPNNHRAQQPGRPGEKAIDEGAIDVRDGGTAIPYDDEDPFIRAEYEAILKQEGVTSRMSPSLYEKKT
jgi:mannose-6-phosphate isomerase-like protein (cupin superfamily)